MKIDEFCNKCGTKLIFKYAKDTIHYGRIDCPSCNKWIKWIKHPKKENIRTKTSKHKIEHIMQFHNYKGKLFCFLCLRTKEQLGEYETLTRDHIQELDKGGEDILENQQILCSACHKLKNWVRLYMNWHLKKTDGGNEQRGNTKI